ncbi:MAG: hypothetical protein HFG27_08550 [Provencibacterium sp.]|jgi:hypothetical protein|nr:hypothetical protein [Provencibacterium sp.]
MFPKPLIPGVLFHTLEHIIRTGGGYNTEKGGQWEPGADQRIPFQGVVLPVSNRDLQYAPYGTFTALSQKLYTNGYTMPPGAQVYDPLDKKTYTIKQELSYGPVHPLKRFAIECKERSAAK